MDRLINDQRIWPHGYTYWHIYAVPNLARDPGLHRLVTECQRVIAGYPAIAAVPLEWLHITIQRIGGRPAAERDDAERAALIAALEAVFPILPPITLTAGSALTTSSGVILDVSPDAAIDQLLHLVRSAIQSVCGAAAIASDSRPAHMSLGYAQSYQDSDVVQRRLRRIRPSHTLMTLAKLELVDVIQDGTRHQYRWTRLHSVPLSGRVRTGGRPR